MSMIAAVQLLGLSQSEIEKSKLPPAKLADGSYVEAFEARGNLRLWNLKKGGEFIEMRDVIICVLPQVMRRFSVLVGQLDGFEERVFRHCNRSKNRAWEISEL